MDPKTAHATDARRALVIAASILALTLSGCAGGAADSDPPPTDTETTAPAEGGDPGGDEGEGDSGDEGDDGDAGLGTITLDTTSYGVLEVTNCDPRQTSDLGTVVYDVVVIAQSAEGQDALFFVEQIEQSGATANFLTYQGPEGRFTADGNATFTVDGGVLSGASSVVDDGNTQSATVQFEFQVPDQTITC